MNFERNLDPKRSMEIGQIATKIRVRYKHTRKYSFEISYKAWELIQEFNRLSKITSDIMLKEGLTIIGPSAIIYIDTYEAKEKIFRDILEEGGNKHWVRETLIKVKI